MYLLLKKFAGFWIENPWRPGSLKLSVFVLVLVCLLPLNSWGQSKFFTTSNRSAGGSAKQSAQIQQLYVESEILQSENDLQDASITILFDSVGSSLPSGAVVPFNLATCPDGWSISALAEGRVVIGVGSADGQTYVLGELGGESFHQLTINEMPSHTHNYNRAKGSSIRAPNSGTNVNKGGAMAVTEATGGDQPHENRPPYVALLFCEKD